MTLTEKELKDLTNLPDDRGRFGPFGGRFVPEVLMPAVRQLEQDYLAVRSDSEFQSELNRWLTEFAGRPSRLYFARRLTEKTGGAKIYLKREDLNHTGAHKINNTLGQALLCRRMGKPRIIAETGAGMHGVATAVAAAAFGLKCTVYMGTEDVRRQAVNVFRMRLLGSEVVPVEEGQQTLKDAINAAMRDWMGSVRDTHYIIGSVVGPHPFPMMIRDFQSVIGREAREQMLQREDRLPDLVIACVGGGSNAAGIFYPFIADAGVELIGVEPGGRGPNIGDHAATIGFGETGVLHGMKTITLQDDEGQTAPVHSVSAGLDYPGTGPEHANWHRVGRVKYVSASDQQAIDAFRLLAETEGIIPALESAHAISYAVELAAQRPKDQIIVVNLSGRGDKDCQEIQQILEKNTKRA